MSTFDSVIDFLPDLVSIPGFLFYSVLAYIFSFTISVCTARIVEKNLNIEDGIKNTINENRKKRD